MRRNAQRPSAEETTARRKTVKRRRTAKMVETARSRRKSARESQESQDSPESQEVKEKVNAVVEMARVVEIAAAEDREEVAEIAVAEAAAVPMVRVKVNRDKMIAVKNAVEDAVVAVEAVVVTTHGRELTARTVNALEATVAAETLDPPAPRPTESNSVKDRTESQRPQESQEREESQETAMVRESHMVATVVTAVVAVAEEAEVAVEAVEAAMAHPPMPTRQLKPRIDNSEESPSTIVKPQSEVTP